MKNRLFWLDGLKGLAVLSGLFLYFSQILIKDFNPINIKTSQSWFVDVLNNFDLYTQMGLILISGLSLTQISAPPLRWWGKKFSVLVLLSTVLYATGQDHRSIFWQVLQSLWFYFPLLYLFHQHKSWGIKIILAALLVAIYTLSLPLWDSFVNFPYLGPIFFGGMNQQVSFNIFSGLPMVALSGLLIPTIFNQGEINHRNLNFSLLGLSIGLVMIHILYKYILTIPFTEGYPPNILQFFSGALTILVLLKIILHLPPLFAPICQVGRWSLINYWGGWFVGSLIFEWNSVGVYSFSAISGSIFLLILLVLIIVLAPKKT